VSALPLDFDGGRIVAALGSRAILRTVTEPHSVATRRLPQVHAWAEPCSLAGLPVPVCHTCQMASHHSSLSAEDLTNAAQ